MWLPTNERKVLCYLYSKFGSRGLGSAQPLELTEFQKICGDEHSSEVAARVLNERKLVKLESIDHPGRRIVIGLTVDGYDLGCKYISWWSCSHLWFAAYKDHWVWLIVSFLGGVLGALIVQWLSD